MCLLCLGRRRKEDNTPLYPLGRRIVIIVIIDIIVIIVIVVLIVIIVMIVIIHIIVRIDKFLLKFLRPTTEEPSA